MKQIDLITAILPFALANACGRWYTTNRGIYGNRLQNIYLDHNRNRLSFADAYFCTFYYRPFSGWELDNPAIDLRRITFLQLETQYQKRYSF